MTPHYFSLCSSFIRRLVLIVVVVLQMVKPSLAQIPKEVGSKNRPGFVHPGVVFDLADLDRMKARLKIEPWQTLYANFASTPEAQLNYKMKGPYKVVGREPNVNRGEYESDSRAIFAQAIQWYMTRNPAYAKNGVAILNAWAKTHTEWSGGTPHISAGEIGILMIMGAEILRHTSPAWSENTTRNVEDYFAKTVWSQLAVGPQEILRGANQGTMQLNSAIAVSVFCNDQEKLAQTLRAWYQDACGSPEDSLPNGEIGDTGRHQPHALIQIRGMALVAETAYKQGIDLYSEQDNRLLAVGEYFSNYNLGNDIPFIPFGCSYDYYLNPGSDRGFMDWGSLPLGILRTAYSVRKGLPMPFTDKYLAALKPNFESFLYSGEKSDKSNPIPSSPPTPKMVAPAPVTELQVLQIGGAKGEGKAVLKDGVWTITAKGPSVKQEEDGGLLAYLPMTGNGTFVAHLITQPKLTSGSAVGIMIRSNLTPDDPLRASLVATNTDKPNGKGAQGGYVQARFPSKTPGKMNLQVQPNPNSINVLTDADRWLKIERNGDRIKLYHCHDGVSWSIAASAPAKFGETAYVGLVLYSDQPGEALTATFDQVAVTPPGGLLGDGCYKITMKNGQALEADATGRSFLASGYDGAFSQWWRLDHVGNSIYRIVNLASAQTLTRAHDGKGYTTGPDREAAAQRFRLAVNGDGSYKISPSESTFDDRSSWLIVPPTKAATGRK